MTHEELRNAINNACDTMRREGLTTMDYMEQLSWLLFLKSFEESDRKVLGDLTIEEFDELIEGYIEYGGPDAVSFAAFGEILADLEAASVQETVELTGVVRGDTIVFDQPRAPITVKDNEIFPRGTKLIIKLREVQSTVEGAPSLSHQRG